MFPWDLRAGEVLTNLKGTSNDLAIGHGTLK